MQAASSIHQMICEMQWQVKYNACCHPTPPRVRFRMVYGMDSSKQCTVHYIREVIIKLLRGRTVEK